MRQKRSTILAWILCAYCVISASIQTVIRLSQETAPQTLYDWVELLGWGLIVPIVFSIVAALIIARRPGNRVGWLLMLPALTIAWPGGVVINSWPVPPASLTAGMWLLLWLDFWSWMPVIFVLFLIPLHFPTGRPLTRRWGWLNVLAFDLWLFFVLNVMFGEEIGPLNEAWRVPNPIGIIPPSFYDSLIWSLFPVGLVLLAVLSLASLFVRYRRAHLAERQQIKWLLYATAVFALVRSLILIFGGDGNAQIPGWVNLFSVITTLGLPIAIGIAILRYRLYDIDLLIRRTAVYAILTAALALVYFGSVILLQAVFDTVSGQQSPIVIVASTLLIAALFSPLRRRVQGIIDRRFYRKKYDAEQILAQFAQTARDEVSLEALTTELTQVVQETMHPDTVTFWLKPSEGGNRP